jgi:hypothetical protein
MQFIFIISAVTCTAFVFSSAESRVNIFVSPPAPPPILIYVKIYDTSSPPHHKTLHFSVLDSIR